MERAEKTAIVKIEGLACGDCASKIEKVISGINGVSQACINPILSELTVNYNPALADEACIRQSVANLGYSIGNSSKAAISTFAVDGLDCADEASLLEKGLKELNGVQEVKVDIIGKTVSVKHSPSCCFEDSVAKKASEFGLKLRLSTKENGFAELATGKKKIVATVMAGLLSSSGFALEASGATPSIYIPFYMAAMASAGIYIAKKAFYAAINLRLDINFLMTVGVAGAAALGEWVEGASVYFLFSVANLIESYTFDRARRAIRSLMELAPDEAWLLRGGSAVKNPVEMVKVGEVILVKPGEKIPLDGRVIKGSSSVDQSPITGESMPICKGAGDDVYSGTINQEGSLEVEVTHLAADSTISRIIDLVEKAQAQKAPAQQFVDRFAKYYTPSVIAMAIGVAIIPPLLFGFPFSSWIYRALVILVISCPCALVISTPVAIVTALTKAAKDGVLIKGGLHMENLAALKAVAFDKTGTLTTGRAALTDIRPLNHLSPSELLRLAASVEANSEHHLARVIVEKAAKEKLILAKCDDFRSVPGKGAMGKILGSTYYVGSLRFLSEAGIDIGNAQEKILPLEREGKTLVLLAEGKTILGALAMADELKGEAPKAIKSLKAHGVQHTALLTGDHDVTARAVANKVGVDECIAKLLPDDKVKTIIRMKDSYSAVAMVGDGVNDAPALAAATVGIAMGAAGTDVALETADVALMADDLSKLPHALRLSKKTLRLIKENIALSLLVKTVFLFMAFPGWSTLWMAVGADMIVSLAVIANSMRILRLKGGG